MDREKKKGPDLIETMLLVKALSQLTPKEPSRRSRPCHSVNRIKGKKLEADFAPWLNSRRTSSTYGWEGQNLRPKKRTVRQMGCFGTLICTILILAFCVVFFMTVLPE